MNNKLLAQITSLLVAVCLVATPSGNALADGLDPNDPLTPLSPLAAGDLDPSFGGFSGDGMVVTPGLSSNAVEIQPDGKIVVVGSDSSGLVIRRYHANGELDDDFGDQGKSMVNAGGNACNVPDSCDLAIQPDGKIVAVGLWHQDGESDYLVARLLTNGRLDLSFGIAGVQITDFRGDKDVATGVALQTDGKIVVAGYAMVGDDTDFAVARYRSDGWLDDTFSDDGDGKVTVGFGGCVGNDKAYAVAIQDNGKIIVAGSADDTTRYIFTGCDITDVDFGLMRLNEDGSLDNSFNGYGFRKVGFDSSEDSAYALAIQEDGKYVLVGTRSYPRNIIVARFTGDGSFDPGFGDGGKTIISITGEDAGKAVALQENGRFVVAAKTDKTYTLLEYPSDGSPGDIRLIASRPTFLEDNYPPLYDLALQKDGKFLVSGGGWSSGYLVRYNPNGSLDRTGKVQTSFGPYWDRALALDVAPDGKIVAAGYSNTNTLVGREIALARYNPDGALDQSFGAGGQLLYGTNQDDTGRALAVTSSGKIVVGGFFEGASDNDFLVYRFHPDGSGDFGDIIDFGYGDDEIWEVLMQQADGQQKIILVGSAARTSWGKLGIGMVRYNQNGSRDTSFGLIGTGLVTTSLGGKFDSILVRGAALQPDGKILVVGGFYGNFIAVRYNANGTLDSSFGGDGVVTAGSVCDDTANAVAVLPNGVIVLAGKLGLPTTNGQCGDPDFGLAFLNADGGVCSNCSSSQGGLVRTDFGGDEEVRAIVIQPDGKILVTGKKVDYDPSGSPYYLARYRYKSVPVNDRGYVLDTSFGGDGKLEVSVTGQNNAWDIALDQQHRILVAGYSFNGNDYDFSLVRLLNDVSAPPPPSDNFVFLPLVVK